MIHPDHTSFLFVFHVRWRGRFFGGVSSAPVATCENGRNGNGENENKS
jgi:hypothetical protein